MPTQKGSWRLQLRLALSCGSCWPFPQKWSKTREASTKHLLGRWKSEDYAQLERKRHLRIGVCVLGLSRSDDGAGPADLFLCRD